MIKGSRLGFSYFWDGESIPVFEQANIASLPAAGAEKHCRLPMMETLPKISRLPSLCVI